MSRLYSETFGHGQPLVMLHGWAMHSGVWRDFAKSLAQHYRVICIDLPGHGRSAPVVPYDLENLSRSLLAVLPEQAVILLGWSLGATLAMAMAERAPERIQRLVLLAGNPHFVETAGWPGMQAQTLDAFAGMLQADVQQTLARFLALQVNGLAHGKALLQTLKKTVSEAPAPDSVVLQAGLELLKSADLRAFVAASNLDIRVLLGEKDALVPVACGASLKQLNPRICVQVLQRAGHAAFLSHAEQVLSALMAAGDERA